MSVIDPLAARRALLRPFVLLLFTLLSWLVAPQASANQFCDSRYSAAGAYPANPQCPLKAAAADFGGMGGYVCGDPDVIAAYCSGPSDSDTSEPVSPEDSMPDAAAGSGNCSADASAGCGNSTSGADPVNLYTGQFFQYTHDLSVDDSAGALALTRVYRTGAYDASGRPLAAAFGVGMGLTYDTMLAMSADRERLELRQATGIRVPFAPRAGNRTWDDLTSPGEYYRARIDTTSSSVMTLTLRDGRTQQFTIFGSVYRLTRLQDRNGNAVVIARDSGTGALTGVTSPNGRVLRFTTLTGNRGTPLVSRVSDPLGRVVAYQYDSQDRLVQCTDAGGGVWRYGWDAQSRLVTVTDPLGNVQVTNTYGDAGDVKDRVVAQKLADNSTFDFAYTIAAGKVSRTEVKDRRGSIRRLDFDANGRVLRNEYPAGLEIAQVQTFVYDTTGRVTKLATADRQYAYTYDANGNRTSEADQYGTLLTRTFDDSSRLLTEAQAGDPQRGVSTRYAYDARGNLLSVTDRSGHRTTWTNDDQGRALTVTDALGGVTKYAWGGADLLAVSDPLDRTTRFTTDAAGRVTAVQDPLGNTTRRTLDALDRTTDVTDAMGGVSRLTWDASGHLLSEADPKGVTTRYTYNATGRPLTRTDPLGHTDTYTWNSAGQLATVRDRKGQWTTYTYDAAGRAQQTDFQSAPGTLPTRSWMYDWNKALNRLDSTRDLFPTADGRHEKETDTLFHYDGVTGRLTRMLEIPNIQGVWSFRYAPDTREVVGLDMPMATVEYSRDADHRLTQVQYTVNEEAPRNFGYAYDALGRLVQATLANGITVTYAWDAASQLTGITYTRSDGSVLGDLTYGYDLAGRRTKAGGTLAKVDLPQAVDDAQYNGANQLTRWAGKTFSYDPNGNLVSDGVDQYRWNEQGLLGAISGGVTANFAYDNFGRRIDRTVNGHRLQSTWIGHDLNFFIPDDDRLKRIRVFSPYPGSAVDEFLFRRIGDDDSEDRYALRDATNNVIALTDNAQQIRTQYRYDPYGVTTQTGAADVNSQQYTARENDGTGLYYYRQRYYSPGTARFISEDPIGWASGQTNAYAYVNGNPLQFTDPFGSQAIPILPPPPPTGPGCSSGSAGVPDWFNNLFNGPTFNRPKNPPDEGPANGWIGGPRRGRDYGPDGLPQRDYDKPHQGNEVDHVHEWPRGVREEPGRPYSPWPREP
ncbi:RHS repeat-associated core domain-containing protein [Paraburkholderia sp. BCC1886]|uniref:RHS repeat-associated core domain-containing protein n=1 Tax=Paraburkholderia sp. BCC1886 TaxID=2562670 RepID=UPI0011838430|nr:RHS repeat-associated core domain-containing protein [Paraburkholderia sp. BCC1886]